MTHLVHTAIRLPAAMVKDIKRVAARECSTFSQFIRTAALKELEAKKKANGS